MSRSYKKNPILKYAPFGNVGQKFANRRVRRYKGELPTKGYSFLKKIYDPWNVHDHVEMRTLKYELDRRESYLRQIESGVIGKYFWKYYENKQTVINDWAKRYRRK